MTFDSIIANLDKSRSDYSEAHLSDFWNIFSDDFVRLLRSPDSLGVYRRNGLTFGLETGLLMAERSLAEDGGAVVEEYYGEEETKDVADRFQRLTAMAGRDFISEILECEAGSPRHAPIDDVKLNVDDLYQSYHAWQISRTARMLGAQCSTIIEIGGGYGSLANKLRHLFPHCRYIVLDLPEVLAIQAMHLTICRPRDIILGAVEVQQNPHIFRAATGYDIALLPGWQTDLLRDVKADLVINMRSMMEMRRPVIQSYFDFIHGCLNAGGLFYCVNRYEKLIGNESVRIKDFPFDDRWKTVLSQPTWLQTHIHELLVERTATPTRLPLTTLLASLPDRSPQPAP
jgi:putative sugar O-methyltransferase